MLYYFVKRIENLKNWKMTLNFTYYLNVYLETAHYEVHSCFFSIIMLKMIFKCFFKSRSNLLFHFKAFLYIWNSLGLLCIFQNMYTFIRWVYKIKYSWCIPSNKYFLILFKCFILFNIFYNFFTTIVNARIHRLRRWIFFNMNIFIGTIDINDLLYYVCCSQALHCLQLRGWVHKR